MHGYKWPINCTRTRIATAGDQTKILPVGLQLMAAAGTDDSLVAVARVVESILGQPDAPAVNECKA